MHQLIRQNMPVIGSDGQPVGIVRGIDGDQLLLVGEVSAQLPLELVEQVAQDVRLRITARDAIDHWLAGQSDATQAPASS